MADYLFKAETSLNILKGSTIILENIPHNSAAIFDAIY